MTGVQTCALPISTLELPPDQILTLVKDSIPEVEEIMASFGRFGA